MADGVDQHEFDESDPQVDAGLSRDLRALFEPAAPHVPPEVNERIINRARAELTGRSRRRASPLRLRWVGVAAAAAAAVVVLVVRLATVSPEAGSLHAANAVADVNRDGRIDILDALALAQAVESNATSGLRDITGDGVVNGRDVDAIAMRAVALDRGSAR